MHYGFKTIAFLTEQALAKDSQARHFTSMQLHLVQMTSVREQDSWNVMVYGRIDNPIQSAISMLHDVGAW